MTSHFHDTSNTHTLCVEGVNQWFPSDGKKSHVLHKINFSAVGGEFLIARGSNGCGKSTLMNLLAGLDTPSEGRILINQRPPDETPVGYLFQNYSASLLPWKTLRENIVLPLEIKGVSGTSQEKQLTELMEITGFDSLPLDRHPTQCSGGQQQKACFLRALLASKNFLLLDEPFASLDHNSRGKMLDYLNKIHTSQSVLVIGILHDLDDAILLADRILCLHGSPTEIKGDIRVNLPWPRESAMRVNPQFLDARRKVLASLGEL